MPRVTKGGLLPHRHWQRPCLAEGHLDRGQCIAAAFDVASARGGQVVSEPTIADIQRAAEPTLSWRLGPPRRVPRASRCRFRNTAIRSRYSWPTTG